ncbi:hypothetical protein AAF712_004651 [Marasmius tenuissimus]|uniref:Uncharacterized protein n=1 Tax=Marasmius tenuissimus TaxID=585030 RepID=A0ABR3A4J6_9AGAR
MPKNPTGKNQHSNGTKPDTDTLKAKLTQYALENLTHCEMIEGLSADLGYHIKDRTLSTLLNHLEIPTTRLAAKKMTLEMQILLVAEKLEDDPNH